MRWLLSWMRQWLRRHAAVARHTNLRLGSNVALYDVTFGKDVRIDRASLAHHVSINDHSYVGPRCVLLHAEIGKYCSVASEVHIGTGSHPSRGFVSTHPIFYLRRPAVGWTWAQRDAVDEFSKTVIGNDVWIGLRAIIKDGIAIGDGAIIGAGAVVVSDVEPYAVYGGVPARFIRWRFDEKQRNKLLKMRWWEMDESFLKHEVEKFHDVDEMISSFEI